MTDNIDPRNMIRAATSRDPELGEVLRKYYERKFTPDSLPSQIVDDEESIPDLPDYAKVDFTLGRGAGQWVDSYVEYARTVSPLTPDLFHESAALWLASTAIARRLVFRLSNEVVFYPNLFIIWVAATTLYRKSTALNIAQNLAQDTFPFLLAHQDTTPEAFLSDLAGMEPANYASLPLFEKESWQKERNFAAQRGWILDEISGLLAGAGRDYNAGLLEALLRLYDCPPVFTRSTMGRGHIKVRNAYLTLIGASTPAAMSQYFSGMSLWDKGFWPRFAILTPKYRPDWQDATATERPGGLQKDLERLFQRLPNDTKWPDPPRQLHVNLGPEVIKTYNNYYRALSGDLLTDDLPLQLWPVYGRLPAQAFKISMILAALDWQSGNIPTIELPHFIRGLEIAENWRESAHRAIAKTNETETARIYERILRQVAKRMPGGATLRDIYKGVAGKTPGEIELAISEMVSINMLAVKPTGEVRGRGRPTEHYVLPTE